MRQLEDSFINIVLIFGNKSTVLNETVDVIPKKSKYVTIT